MGYCKALSQNFRAGTEENHDKLRSQEPIYNKDAKRRLLIRPYGCFISARRILFTVKLCIWDLH